MTIRSFRLVTQEDSQYDQTCALIESRFREVFDTRIARRPHAALALTEGEGTDTKVIACVSLSNGRTNAFFSERYLAEPAEVEIARALGRPVDRDQIAEIGALSAQ